MKAWIELARPHRRDLESLPITPQGGGILLSEMLLFLTVCFHNGVTRVVESGRKAGYSTEILHNYKHRFELISIEKTPDPNEEPRVRKACVGSQLMLGDGMQLIPSYISGRTALLLDGPKGPKALDLFQAHRAKVCFASIHDVCLLQHNNEPSEFRKRIEREHPDAVFSDDPDWLAEFAEMDRPYWSWGNNYKNREEMVRHSFTLCVIPGGLWRALS